MKKLHFGRRFKYGSMAILLSIVVILAILALNIGATLLTDRLGLQADMTEDGRYEISQATYDLVENLKDHVTIYVLATEQQMRSFLINGADGRPLTSYTNEIVETLKMYPVISNGMIDLEFVDVGKNPEFLKQFSGLGTVESYTVIVANDNGGYRVIEPYQLYYWYYPFDESYEQSVDPVGIDVERSVASALLYLKEENRRKAVFLTGHGEPENLTSFAEFLTLNNFECTSANLEIADLPEDTDLVVLCAPTLDYSLGMISKLEKYLAKSNTYMIAALNPANGKLTEIQSFLSDYGIDIDNRVIYDTRLASGASTIAAVLSNDEEMFDYMPTSANVMMPLCMPISVNEGRPTSFEARQIASSSDSSFAKVGTGETVSEIKKEDGDLAGPFGVAAISSYSTWSDALNTTTYTKILGLGSAFSLYNEYFYSSKYSNEAFFATILKDFFNLADLSRFEGHEFAIPSIILLNWEKTLCLCVLSIIPIALLIAGVAVWLRRKNK